VSGTPRGGQRVIGAAVLMIASIGLSRIVGLVRMKVFASWYGATPETDAFVLAFALPDLVFLLVGGGVIASAFIPYFAGRIQRGEEDAAWHTFSNLLAVVGGGLALLLGGLFLAAPYLVPMVVSKLSPDVQPLCVDLTRIMLGAQWFMFFGGLAMGALNAKHNYWVPALGPILYNLCIIGGIVLFGANEGLYAAAWAVLIGALISNTLLQVPALRAVGARLRPTLDFSDPGLRQVLVFMVPVILSLCVIHIDTIISKYLATGDPFPGAATCLENAYRLAMVPVGMFAMGAGVASLPTLSENVAAGDMDTYRRHLSLALRTVLFLTIPTVLLIGALAGPIVGAIYEGGAFTAEDARYTSVILVYFCLGIVGLAGQQFLPRAFYALNDSVTPCIIGAASVVVHVVLAVSLFPVMATPGTALATAIASLLAFAAMLIALRRRIGHIDGRRVLVSVLKITSAAAIAAVAARAAHGWVFGGTEAGSALARVTEAAAPLGIGLAAFVSLIPLLRIEEGLQFWESIRRRWGGRSR
jgi:putative peptidoglycan lipid II flippase